ncbi:hypothetical protein SERLA73DRAFT_78527 [Serpula lacrymans var. lacrymans S7.3]|uniref:Uncharacterized protein n=2 Tax=Serpula lacrymans var. lacrymans TaxID=341189 RepID=F8QDI8_SERL3|nr:uncharacterized protein SERLADRAFT_443569 [Serpula lacrymans var. lacrymans S7.9]EGN93659.1 hypothetical protein SERLA73DRAFT_78527 [Serpula lacrymans var. lacrymans S7.3]EGO19036.1 hypothetical protein SERLADRAFT_443569 [Serpula lacrymans var. lacrymans S7.9]
MAHLSPEDNVTRLPSTRIEGSKLEITTRSHQLVSHTRRTSLGVAYIPLSAIINISTAQSIECPFPNGRTSRDSGLMIDLQEDDHQTMLLPLSITSADAVDRNMRAMCFTEYGWRRRKYLILHLERTAHLCLLYYPQTEKLVFKFEQVNEACKQEPSEKYEDLPDLQARMATVNDWASRWTKIVSLENHQPIGQLIMRRTTCAAMGEDQ